MFNLGSNLICTNCSIESTFKHTWVCKSLMQVATVGYSEGPEKTLVPAGGETAQLLCLLLLQKGVTLHLDTFHQLQPGDSQGPLLSSVTASAHLHCRHNKLYVASQKYAKPPVLHTLTGCYYRCTVMCVQAVSDPSFTLPEPELPINRQRKSYLTVEASFLPFFFHHL